MKSPKVIKSTFKIHINIQKCIFRWNPTYMYMQYIHSQIHSYGEKAYFEELTTIAYTLLNTK